MISGLTVGHLLLPESNVEAALPASGGGYFGDGASSEALWLTLCRAQILAGWTKTYVYARLCAPHELSARQRNARLDRRGVSAAGCFTIPSREGGGSINIGASDGAYVSPKAPRY